MREKCLWVALFSEVCKVQKLHGKSQLQIFIFNISLSSHICYSILLAQNEVYSKVIPPFCGNSKCYHEALSIHLEVIKHSLTFSTSHFHPMEELTDTHMKLLGSLS